MYTTLDPRQNVKFDCQNNVWRSLNAVFTLSIAKASASTCNGNQRYFVVIAIFSCPVCWAFEWSAIWLSLFTLETDTLAKGEVSAPFAIQIFMTERHHSLDMFTYDPFDSINIHNRRSVGDKPMSCKPGVACSILEFSQSVEWDFKLWPRLLRRFKTRTTAGLAFVWAFGCSWT